MDISILADLLRPSPIRKRNLLLALETHKNDGVAQIKHGSPRREGGKEEDQSTYHQKAPGLVPVSAISIHSSIAFTNGRIDVPVNISII